MDELNLELWRRHGWFVPEEFRLEDDQTHIDITSQYLLSFQIDKSITNKPEFFKTELVPLIIEKLQNEFVADENGEFECLDHVRYHLGEIVDDSFYANPCVDKMGIKCSSCDQYSPDTFSLCWLCGSMLQADGKIRAYANVFIEGSVEFSIDDLIRYQYDEGPHAYAEEIWNDIYRDLYVEMSEFPLNSFHLRSNKSEDYYLETETFEIFVRFNPQPVVEAN